MADFCLDPMNISYFKKKHRHIKKYNNKIVNYNLYINSLDPRLHHGIDKLECIKLAKKVVFDPEISDETR